MNTMSLAGGLFMYSESGRYVDNKPPIGRKVAFLDDNGYESQRDYARKFFKKGQVLTVKEIYVDRSFSEVEFVELPNERFNTVMFIDV